MSGQNGRHVAKSDLDGLTLAEVQERRQLVEKKVELAVLERKQSLLESLAMLGGGWGSMVDPRESFFDRDEMGPVPLMSSPSDRMHGDNWPMFRDAQQHGKLRQQSRVLSVTNSYARGLLKNLTNYVIGKGFKYKVVSKEKVATLSDAAAAKLNELVAQVQNVIDEFRRVNRWLWREREAFRRNVRDGDAALRFWFLDNGATSVRFVDPERIIDPPGANREDGWSYGILHAVEKDAGGTVTWEDVETTIAYNVANAANSAIGCAVPAYEILFFKNLDEDVGVKRGMPAFTYDVLDSLRRAAKLQRNMSISSAIQAAIAEIQQFESATKEEITNLASQQTDLTVTNPNTGSQENLQYVGPGTVRRIPKGKTYVPPPFSQGIPAHLSVVQGDLRMASSAFSAPEYMTGDASNADYSSTKEAGAPFIKAGETDQAYYAELFVEAMWKAVRHAVECNRLPPEALDLVDIQASGPAVLHKNQLEQAQTDQIYVQLGAKDRQTVSGEIGQDWEMVRANNLQYEEEFGQQGQSLGLGDLLGGGNSDVDANRSRAAKKGWAAKGHVGEGRDASGHEHGADGKFGSGGGSAAPKADTHADKLAGAEKDLPPAKKKLVGRVVDFVKKQYGELESSYGRKGAIAIMGAAIVLSPLPGSSLVPVAAIGMAKAYKAIKAKQRPGKTESVHEGDDEAAQIAAVRELIAAAHKATGEDAPELSDDEIREALGRES